jgi:TRAP-type C4-dicarboxylate transport system permease small subunit
MRTTINRTVKGLGALVEWLTAALITTLVIVVSANVVARYFLQVSLLWAEEVSRLAFVWVVFLGATIALRRRTHLAISFVTDRLPLPAREAVYTLVMLLTLAFLGAIGWGGIDLVRQTIEFGRLTPILGISAAWGYLAVPVAALLMFLETLRALVMREHLEVEKPETAQAQGSGSGAAAPTASA